VPDAGGVEDAAAHTVGSQSPDPSLEVRGWGETPPWDDPLQWVEQPTDLSGLAGRSFLLESAQGFQPITGTVPRLSFRERGIGFSAGCNGYGGVGTLANGRLIATTSHVTEMACRGSQDDWLANFLSSNAYLVVDRDRITLSGYAATLVFVDRRVAEPDQPLVGTTWSVNGLIGGGLVGLGPRNDSTIVLSDDGTVHVDTTCNTGTGRYSVLGDQLTLIDVSYTTTDCGEENTQLDTHIRGVFTDGALTFDIYASRLHVMSGSNGFFAYKYEN
jgi:heat shock protein HslJ